MGSFWKIFSGFFLFVVAEIPKRILWYPFQIFLRG